MTMIVIALLFLFGAFALPKTIPDKIKARFPRIGYAGMGAMISVALLLIASTSYVYIPSDKVGHIKKIYGGTNLENGRIIAANGEKGYQARTLPPGFHFIPLINVINQVDIFPMVVVPAGYYARIIAKDGVPLDTGEILAQPWANDKFTQMLDAEYFMQNGGQKGIQTTVLPPGTYPMNLYLYNIRIGIDTNGDEVYDGTLPNGFEKVPSPFTSYITQVPAGFVGVVKSNITERNVQCMDIHATTENVPGALSVKLVPQGCRGIWNTVLQPGNYYINREAYGVTLVDTRVITWEYKGGYTKRFIDLTVGGDGQIQQHPSSIEVPYKDTYADPAPMVKMQGWDIPVELRVLVQITPENAPIVVGAVGGVEAVENNILTPTIRSIVRNVAAGNISYTDEQGKRITRPTTVNDLLMHRDVLESNVEQLVAVEGAKAGVLIREIRFGEPAIPPELLVAYRREQLAGQLSNAFIEERKAQMTRQETEQARATADKQGELVSAQIALERAKLQEQEQAARGRGEKTYLTLVAEGQREQANVLGRDNVLLLNALQQILATFQAKPELAGVLGKMVPEVYVGNGGGLEGAAAVLGQLIKK